MKSTVHSDEEVQLLRSRSSINRSEECRSIPRLIDRNQPFYQSKSNVAIHNRVNKDVHVFRRSLKYIINQNWFHLLLRWPTWISLFSFLFLWVLWLLLFAYAYVFVDAREPLLECGLGSKGEPIKFAPALSFSLETCTTVGYSLPNDTNAFFEAECYGIQMVIYMQMTWSMIFNAFFTAFLFARLARCEQRSAQVLFSNKAIIEKKDGKWLLHVRVYDVDSQLPIVEAHMRMYCASWLKYDSKQQGQPHLLHSMRIFDPNDELNSWMFTGVPMNASHHIDAYSPLTPEYLRKDLNLMKGHGLMLREVDQIAGNTSAYPCPVCGEGYETAEQLKTHIKFNIILEDADKNVPQKGTHRDPDIVKPRLTKKLELTEEDITEHLEDKEIICIVEGIEPMISGTFQCLHSYKLEDIVFDSKFTPCVCKENGKIFVDLDKFHSVEKYSMLTRSEDEYRSFGETS